nr:TIR domain-containing protein [Oleiagrimonas sp. C23AA]
MSVPVDRLDDALAILKEDGAYVGFVHQTTTGPFVSIDDLQPVPVTGETAEKESADSLTDTHEGASSVDDPPASVRQEASASVGHPVPSRTELARKKVFITHGRNKKIVDQVKDVLGLYEIDYEIAVEEESPAIPVPQKVLSAMRRCGSGVMIVSADDDAAAEAGTINNNVLIEIGAAFVLYDQRVVLLWDKRLKVPSNLQGLYRCEFEGGELSFAVGTKLAKAVKGFRSP